MLTEDPCKTRVNVPFPQMRKKRPWNKKVFFQLHNAYTLYSTYTTATWFLHTSTVQCAVEVQDLEKFANFLKFYFINILAMRYQWHHGIWPCSVIDTDVCQAPRCHCCIINFEFVSGFDCSIEIPLIKMVGEWKPSWLENQLVFSSLGTHYQYITLFPPLSNLKECFKIYYFST